MRIFMGTLSIFILLAVTVLAALYYWDIRPFSSGDIQKTLITIAILFAGAVLIYLAVSFFLNDPAKGYNEQISERVSRKG